jgi:hypothetical protein
VELVLHLVHGVLDAVLDAPDLVLDVAGRLVDLDTLPLALSKVPSPMVLPLSSA